MATRSALAVVSFLLLAALAGCGCAECCEERLPFRGHATAPDDLVKIVQYEARYECKSEMYDLLSARTRDKYSRLEWRLGVSSIRVPDYDYRVIDVAEKGTYIEFLGNPQNPDEGFAYYDYQEPPKRKMKLKLLLLREGTPAEWRIAMLDQNERIERGLARYWWFDRER
jgi:hypothetical protein